MQMRELRNAEPELGNNSGQAFLLRPLLREVDGEKGAGEEKRNMTFLAIKDETAETLRLLRHKGETDDDLIKRLVEYARCYMILWGMEDTKETI
jgi:hypothetical protein